MPDARRQVPLDAMPLPRQYALAALPLRLRSRNNDKRWNSKLRDMIITGAAKPPQVVSHHFPMEEAPMAFANFDTRRDGFIKVILKPA